MWTPGFWGFVGGIYDITTAIGDTTSAITAALTMAMAIPAWDIRAATRNGNQLYYNRSVNNVNVTNINNVYNRTVINNTTINRVSYNGPGGVTRGPTAAEQAALRQQRVHR